MSTHRPSAMTSPVAAGPARFERSVRRTSTMDMIRSGDNFRFAGLSRDLRTRGASAEVVDDAAIEALSSPGRALLSLVTTPQRAAAQDLVGRGLMRGFRDAVRTVLPDDVEGTTALALLLDELPVAALIAGYGQLYNGEIEVGRDGGPGPDTCSGWRADGVMMTSVLAGDGVPVTVGPRVPDASLEPDPLAWHHTPPLPANSMRRRRLVDVADTDPYRVTAWFRDSHVNSHGTETVLHEYTVRATVDRDSLVLTTCDAVPQVLPWVECPVAAASAWSLVGTPIGEVRRAVRSTFHGTHTCTHLNDLLRSVGDVPALIGRL